MSEHSAPASWHGTGPDRVLALVPALNESASIGGIVTDLRRLGFVDVLVIDDGSVDDTAAVARRAGAEVAPLPVNLGIGGALQTGFRIARSRGYSVAFQFDADGQHVATEVQKLLEPVRSDVADLVIGSRFADGRDPYAVGVVRRATMWLLARTLTRICRQPMTDVSSGFRAFGPAAIELFARDYPKDYMESVEALVMAARAGLRIVERPVVMRERAAGQASASPLAAAVKTLRMLVSVVLIRMIPAESAR